MALNIFPRRRETAQEAVAEAPQALPEPSPEVLAEAEAEAAPPRRTATRRPRATKAAKETAAAVEANTPLNGDAPADTTGDAPAEEAPKPARRTRSRAAKAEPAAEAPPAEAAEASAPAEPEAAPADAEQPAAESAPPAEEETSAEGHDGEAHDGAVESAPSRRRRGGRGRGGRGSGAAAAASENGDAPADDASPEPQRALAGAPGDVSMLVRAIERQTRQLETHSRLIEQLLRDRDRNGGSAIAAGGAVAHRPRVGIFVDVANVELASDRLRARFDWGKILDLLTEGRQLVRAMAYSPVHDDPQVSIETQRFVEPFLDKGYKIVTKPLKRFQDGSIKANVDVELALDVMAMLDRLDVVCLVSGDGDFQRLVEVVQSRGVQVDVVSVAQSTASNLRNAADRFIDLGARLREIRV